MPIVIRLPRADELAHAEELVARSINDLTTRHGFGSIAAARTPDFQAFCLHDDPRGVWLAEDDGEMAGFALSWVCGPLWFLAELFVAPGRQGQGIGNELLDRTLQHAAQAGAELMARHEGLDAPTAQQVLHDLLDPKQGLLRDMRLRSDAVATVLALRGKYAAPLPAGFDPSGLLALDIAPAADRNA